MLFIVIFLQTWGMILPSKISKIQRSTIERRSWVRYLHMYNKTFPSDKLFPFDGPYLKEKRANPTKTNDLGECAAKFVGMGT